MQPLAIVVAGEPLAQARAARGTWPDMIRRTVGESWDGAWVEVDGRGPLPDPSGFAGLIITGSSASVTERADWILSIESFLARAVGMDVPTLGICFGHQLLGQALGGLVARNPHGREIGTVDVEITEQDPLLAEAPPPFLANMTHVDSVVKLPSGARVLARTALEPYAAIRFAPLAWGVQFHPEVDGEVMARYVEARFALLESEGLNARAIRGAVRDAPAGARVLRRFVEHAILGKP